MPRSVRPVTTLIERGLLKWALRELKPTHKAVPKIVRRLADAKNAPSPLDPADSIVTGACIAASLALLAMVLAGWIS